MTARIRVLSWDWREQPDLVGLMRILSNFGVHLAVVDTRSDQYAIVLSDVYLMPDEVEDEYLHYLTGGDDEA